MKAWPTYVHRFSKTERTVHWVNALGFFFLLVTGLILYLPALSVAVGNRQTVQEIHFWGGVGWVASLLIVAVLGDSRGLLRTARELDVFAPEDVNWLKRRRPNEQPRFNAGQKLNGILTIAATVGFIVTGIIVWRPPYIAPHLPSWLFSDTISNNAVFLHQILTIVSIPLVLGHIYLAALARATRPALSAILDGTVPLSYAREHHAKWAAELEGVPVDHAPAAPARG